jgi:hypothetical protein
VTELPKAIVTALASEQTEFRFSEPSTDAHCVFVTAVVGSPIQVMGRLSRAGEWRISTLLTPPGDERRSDAQAALDELAEDGILILRTEPVAATMIRFAIGKVLDVSRLALRGRGLEETIGREPLCACDRPVTEPRA